MNKSYRDLVAWQKAMDLVTAIYEATASFPKEELFGLTSQLRRAAVSIPSNIAEGQGRDGVAEFRHFLRQASGSLMELETQVMIAARLCYVSQDSADRIWGAAQKQADC
jgi:four helix bundle protein